MTSKFRANRAVRTGRQTRELEKRYNEREIVDAVIKSISSHSNLRSYVLTLPDGSLAKLRSIPRVLFHEKTAANLYQALVTTCQKPKETQQQFLLKALDTPNNALFASEEENPPMNIALSRYKTHL